VALLDVFTGVSGVVGAGGLLFVAPNPVELMKLLPSVSKSVINDNKYLVYFFFGSLSTKNKQTYLMSSSFKRRQRKKIYVDLSL